MLPLLFFSLSFFVVLSAKDMVGVLQRKTVNIIKLAGEMGRLEREPVVDADVKARLRCWRGQLSLQPAAVGIEVVFFWLVCWSCRLCRSPSIQYNTIFVFCHH